MSNLLLRMLTGVVFVAALVLCTVLSPFSFVVLFAVATGLAVWEFSSVVNNYAGASVNGFINTAAGVFLFVAIAGNCMGVLSPHDYVPYLLTLVYLLVSELYRRQPEPLKNWAYAFASQLYVALPFALLSVLAFRYDAMQNSVRYEWIYPLSVFIFLWTSDTGAYLCGSALHRRFPAKLFERISPSKSWVGSIGGGLLCLLAAVALWHFFPDKMTLPQWLGLGATVCVAGTWGDLVESLLKRQLGIKDSGNILPGHGGMLDRFDSALLAIPFAVLYFWFLERYTANGIFL